MKPVLLAAFGLVLAATPAAAQNKNELMRTDQECSKISGEKGVVAAFDACFADDAIQFNGAPEPLSGKAKILEDAKSMGDVKLTWEPRMAEVAVGGDMGWTWGRWSMTGKSKDGKAIKRDGKYITVWKRTKGAWKIAFDGGEPDQPGKK